MNNPAAPDSQAVEAAVRQLTPFEVQEAWVSGEPLCRIRDVPALRAEAPVGGDLEDWQISAIATEHTSAHDGVKLLDEIPFARAVIAASRVPGASVAVGEPPHGWVLVPNEPATPTPDYEECARQADVATGLPSLYRNPWLNIFIREINRWCQHRATPVPAGAGGDVGAVNQKDPVRIAGGIVHKDGNIFFTNRYQFEHAASLVCGTATIATPAVE